MVATLRVVRILDGMDVIAEHPRCYGKTEQIEKEEHLRARLSHKHQARYHRGQNRLSHAAPSSREFLERAAQLGNSLTSLVALLIEMRGDYGAEECEAALVEALQQDVPHPNAVRQVLERRREQRNQPPPMAVPLTNTEAKNSVVKPASLASYDPLGGQAEQENDETSTAKKCVSKQGESV